MGIKYPFGLDKETLIGLYKSTPGGFYPLGENNMWHGGIHIKGQKKSKSELEPVTPVLDGEIVAARISGNYCYKEPNEIYSKSFINSIKKAEVDENNKIIPEELINKVLKKEIKDFSDLFEDDDKKIFYKIKNNADEETVAKLLNLEFSNNFVLIRHKKETPGGEEITFFSLYMHLKPYDELITNRREAYKNFIYKKTYTGNSNQIHKGVKLLNNKIIPNKTLVAFNEKYLGKDEKEYTKTIEVGERRKKYIKVDSLFTGDTDYINSDFLNPMHDNVTYTADKDLLLFAIGSLEKIGSIKKGTNFQIQSASGHTYYEMDKNTNTKFTYKEKNKYLHINLDRTSKNNSDLVSIDEEIEGYICYKYYKNAYEHCGEEGKRRLINDFIIYEKNGKSYTPKRRDKNGIPYYFAYKGDIVETEYNVDVTHFYDSKSQKHFRKIKVVSKHETSVTAAIKLDESSIKLPDLQFIVDIKDRIKKTVNTPIKNAFEDYVEVPILDCKKREYKVVVKKDSKLLFLGDEYVDKNNVKFLKVTSESSGLTGFIRRGYCRIKDGSIYYKATKDLTFYEKGARSVIGKIKKGSLFKIPEFTRKYFKDYGDSSPTLYYDITIETIKDEVKQVVFNNENFDRNSSYSGSVRFEADMFIVNNLEFFNLWYEKPIIIPENITTVGYETVNNKENTDEIKDFESIKGILVYNKESENSPVIDIIKEGDNIEFLHEEEFLTKPYNLHPIKLEGDKIGYIDVGKQSWLEDNIYLTSEDNSQKNKPKLPVKVDFELRKDIKEGDVTIFENPVRALNSTVLGYPGTFFNHQNILHLELFTANTDFTKINVNSDETKYLYKIEKGAGFVKEKAEKDSKIVPFGKDDGEDIFIPNGSLFKTKKVKDSKYSFKVELVAGPTKDVWINDDKDSLKAIKNNIVTGNNKNKLKIYNKSPRYKRELIKKDSGKIKLNPGDKVQFIRNSSELDSSTIHSKKYGDYRLVTITKIGDEPVTKWFERCPDNYTPLEWIESSRTYKVKKDNYELTVYKECPLYEYTEIKDDSLKELDINNFVLYKGYIIKELEPDSSFPEEDEICPSKTYRKVKLPIKPVDNPSSNNAYIYTKDKVFNFNHMGDNLKQINNKIIGFYNSPPEVYKTTGSYTVKKDIEFTKYKNNKKTKAGKFIYSIETNDSETIYLEQSDFDNTKKVKRYNYYKWDDFGFHDSIKDNGDGILQLEEVYSDKIKELNSLKDLNTLKKDGIKKANQFLKDKELTIFNKAITNHPTEWEKKDSKFFDLLKEKPFKLSKNAIDREKELNKKLAWWKEKMGIKELPKLSEINYFHPVDFLEHLKHVIAPDVRLILKDAGNNNRVTEYQGVTITFTKFALDGANLGLTTKYADNVIKSLTTLFKMCNDPVMCQYMDNKINITSTYTTESDPGHKVGLAIDLTGIFWFANSDGSPNTNFSKETVALAFDHMAKNYGIKQFLFNCPYVIENCKDAYVNGRFEAHQHHVHMDFEIEFKYNRYPFSKVGLIEYTNNFQCYHGNYRCPCFNNCEWNKDVHEIDYNKIAVK